jgi:ABC-type dipeptide/oligopeptide/nickel transport system permease subunit
VNAAVETRSPPPDEAIEGRGGYWAQTGRRLARQPLTLAAIVVLAGLLVTGGLAAQIAPERWNSLDLAARWHNHPPTLAARHFLGTDNIGRDVLVRVLWGLHETEQAALLGALLAALIGIVAGGLAGLYGGWLDAVVMRFVDLVTAFPAIVLMIAAFFFLAPLTVAKATLVFALYLWTQVARALRARIVTLGGEEYVHAARALGASDARIFFRHLLPNAAGTVVVAATALLGQIVLIEATAEFFGFGVASLNRPTLGNLLAEATTTGIGRYNTLGLGWWVWVSPACVLFLILLTVNLIGDGLDNALNPRARRSR